MIKLNQRIKLCTYFVIQLTLEEALVERLSLMSLPELISYKVFIEDIVKSQKYVIDLSLYRSSEPVKEKLKRSQPKNKFSANIAQIHETLTTEHDDN